MITVVDVLIRADGYTHEEFVDRWRGEHVAIAAQLPGLKRYSTSVPTEPDEAEYDGVLNLSFESVEAMNEAFASEVGTDVMDDAAEFIDVGAGPRMVVEETIHVTDE
ncbi:EthD family reductase [Natrinema altunense]|uniref:EthD family reductase n=1 Tax=Natrinema altunense TaxID=222984 RepID=A0A482Y122_9EURY|nr:EthD family reductase [Natrinema altunense]RZH67805.1 EthD family reductase [Natrinema altunense]